MWSGLGAVLFSCSPPKDGTNFNYLRSPNNFGSDTTAINHRFCDADYPFPPFDTKEECLAAKKYQLTWLRPEDTVQLIGYRIYLDTLDPPGAAGKHWEAI
ncbi:MAG: hypothetical protein ABI036_16290, partial [Fibrobacteria bacterium]